LANDEHHICGREYPALRPRRAHRVPGLLRGCQLLASKGEARIARNDEQPAKFCQVSQDVFGDAVTEFSWSGSPDKFVKGGTAIEGLSGRVSVGPCLRSTSKLLRSVYAINANGVGGVLELVFADVDELQ
jgi:hypothetical protein